MKYKKNILIIDDMKQIRDILWFSLKQEGYKPILAENGHKGLQILFDPETDIDLVILDVMMPRMDGFQVLELIRDRKDPAADVPVILLTAKAQKDDVLKGIRKGANDYIVKPYTFPDLLEKIKNLVG